MAKPIRKFLVRVNGIAASRTLSRAAAERAADRAIAARPDAVVSLVEICVYQPEPGEISVPADVVHGEFVLHRPNC